MHLPIVVCVPSTGMHVVFRSGMECVRMTFDLTVVCVTSTDIRTCSDTDLE